MLQINPRGNLLQTIVECWRDFAQLHTRGAKLKLVKVSPFYVTENYPLGTETSPIVGYLIHLTVIQTVYPVF
jgi:hypothetical protein